MLETSTRLKPSWHGDSEGLSASRLTFQSIHLNNPSVQSQAGKDRSSSRNQKKTFPAVVWPIPKMLNPKKAANDLYFVSEWNWKLASKQKSSVTPEPERLSQLTLWPTSAWITARYISSAEAKSKLRREKEKKGKGQQFSCTVHSQKSYSFFSSEGLTLPFGCKCESAAGRGRRQS